MKKENKTFTECAFSKAGLAFSSVILVWIVSCRIVYILEQSYCAFRKTVMVFPVVLALTVLTAAMGKKRLRAREKSVLYSVFVSFISIYALSVYIDTDHSLIWGILFCTFAYLVYRAVLVQNRNGVYQAASVLGVIFALFIFVGFQLKKYGRLEFLYIYDYYEVFCLSLGHYFLILSGFSFLFTVILLLFFDFVLKPAPEVLSFDATAGKCRRPLFLTSLFFIAVWAIYYYAFYPGIISADSLEEIYCQLALRQVKDASPLMHQWLILLALKVGQCFGSLRLGVGFYSATQLISMALCFGFCVSFLWEIRAPRLLVLFITAFYAFFPVNAFYSVTMWKNIPFSLSTVLLITFLIREAYADDKVQKGIKPVVLAIVAFFFATLQKNGFAVFLIGFAFFVLFCGYSPKRRKKMTIVYISVIVLFICYRMIVNSMDVEKGKIGEALSIPIQQIARVVKVNGIDEDCAEDLETLSEVFTNHDILQLGELYKSYISDPVKGEGVFHSADFIQTPWKYTKCWLRIGMRHPLIYLEAFLLQNYGYWYPDVQYWIVVDTIDKNTVGLSFSDATNGLRHALYELLKTYSQHEPATVIFSLGGVVWLSLAGEVAVMMKHRRKYAAPAMILLVLWLTTLGAPVYCEYRYLYGLVISTPVILGVAAAPKNDISEV